MEACCRSSRKSVGGEEDEGGDDEEGEVERALRLDGSIPGTSDEFVKTVSSRAYDMRRHLQQSFESSSYDGIASDTSFCSQRLIVLLSSLCRDLLFFFCASNPIS